MGSRPAARSGRTGSGSGARSRTTTSRARRGSNSPASPSRVSRPSSTGTRSSTHSSPPSNALTLSYTHFERSFLGFQFRRDRSAESNWNNGRPGQSFRLEDSQVLSSRLFASFYLAYVRPPRRRSTPVGGVDEQADQDEDGIWRHSYRTRRFDDDQRQAGLNASAFFDTGNLKHELKFGFGYRQARLDST